MASPKEIEDLARLVQDALPQSEKEKRILFVLDKTGKLLTQENIAELKNLAQKCKERISELSELKKLEAEQRQILDRMYDLDPLEVQGEKGKKMQAQIGSMRGRLTSLSAKLKKVTEEKVSQKFFDEFTGICIKAEEEYNERNERGRKLEAELKEILEKLTELRKKLEILNEESKKGEKVGAEIAKIRDALNGLYRRKREIEAELKKLEWS